MGKARERRLLAQMRKADARKKSTLLIKNYVEKVMGGEPLLTELEAFKLMRSFDSDEERQEYNIALSALKSLSGCIEEVRVKQLKVITIFTFLGNLFSRAKEYRNFENLLNELCMKSDGVFSKRLQERAVKFGRLVPYFYNIGLEEKSEDQQWIVLKLSDQELALTKEVTEALEQEASELKALTKATRDLMKEYTTSISSFGDLIDSCEKCVREGISLTKRMLFNTNFEQWDELRDSLEKHSDSLLAMMDDLPDYDEIVFDEELYKEKVRSLNQEIANRLQSL